MFKRAFKYLIGAVVLVIAALFVGALPLPAEPMDKSNSADSVRIYVLSNGFHSDIAIPSEGGSLAALGIEETDFPVNLNDVEYWAIGWGSITAYTSLLALSDITFGIAAKALTFDEAVMHITPLGALEPSEKVFAFDVNPVQYNELLTAIEEWFSDTDPMEVTQGFGDRFYPARGSFTPWMSCNTWTGQRLRQIGIGVGVWTPLSQSLEFGLRHRVSLANSL